MRRNHDALLLTDGELPVAGQRLGRMLEFFGVPWRSLPSTQARNEFAVSGNSRCRLLARADHFLQLVEDLDRHTDGWQLWQRQVHSAFVYASADRGTLDRLLDRFCDGGRRAERAQSGESATITNELDDFCGVMSGVRSVTRAEDLTGVPGVESCGRAAVRIITVGKGAVFLKVEHETVPVFIAMSPEVVDVNGDLGPRHFDVREHFVTSVPAVLYVKWAFSGTSWNAPETNACLVIDDPLLRRTYGCVDFQDLLSIMQRHGFSTNIAFIPWNWRRSDSDVVRLFRGYPERFSLSVHGCDHTGGEFGSSDAHVLAARAKLAAERMRQHESATGIHHDQVMVFPQGVFSTAAMGALKHTGYVAAVNTEVVSVDASPAPLKVSDAWDVAIMRYGGFPLFTRRYPRDGVANFAFDALLGKPIIIVIHHDFCRNHCSELVEFVQHLNALNCALSWRSLGDVVRRSYRRRDVNADELEVETYGSEVRLDNPGTRIKRFHISRREPDPSAVKRMHAGDQPITWRPSGGCVHCEIDIDPGTTALLRVEFDDRVTVSERPAPLSEKVKTSLRRYLSEARDNYVVPNRIRLAGLFR
jgi:hypothetical protein